MTSHETTPTELAETYVAAWTSGDFETLRSILADDVTFRGPLGTADDADACVAGLRGMSQILTDVVVHARAVHGSEVLTFFDLHTSVAAPAPTASWMHVEDGRIARIRVTFDSRGILAAGDR